MSDEDALLAAIAEHPAEDTPRLMYADWLEEHGRHVRAEFIRVQIEVSRIEQLPRIELNQYVRIFQRNQDLLDNHRAELLGPLAELPPYRFDFNRGFLAAVKVPVSEFLEWRPLLAQYRPLPLVTVTAISREARAFLGIDSSFPNFEFHRDIVTGLQTLSEDDDATLTTGPPVLRPSEPYPLVWPRLAELDLSGCGLGDEYAASVLQPTAFPVLAELDLSANALTDTGVSNLLATVLPRQLKRLILSGNDITDVGAIALAERWPTGDADRLETLNLRFTQIGQAGQAALLRRFGGRVDLF